jgi:predicted metal-dependent hydrolase
MQIKEKLKISDTFYFPLIISIEKRQNSRASIGKKSLRIRLPEFLTESERQAQIEKFKKWAVKHLQKKAPAIEMNFAKSYKDGEIITVRGKNFRLHINTTSKTRYYARIIDGDIFIEVPANARPEFIQEHLRILVIKCISNHFYMDIAQRLIELNKKYFQRRIVKFSLRYMNSRWGSCSPRGHISISSRLLLAPPDVMDYVLIHELAHLVHHNHSYEFWNEVKRAMPDYKEKEKWLRDNDYHADF